MTELKWLDTYSDQSADELVALASEYRVDSIVLAFEQALQQKADRIGLSELSEVELTVLAVEALEREVNNGGYHQFFVNVPEHAAAIVAALTRIGCQNTAEVSEQAIARLGLRQPFTAEQVQTALDKDSETSLIDVLGEHCDQLYHSSGEPIADRLFAYIRANHESIHLGMSDAR